MPRPSNEIPPVWGGETPLAAEGADDLSALISISCDWNVGTVLDHLTTCDDLFGVPQLDLATFPDGDCFG